MTNPEEMHAEATAHGDHLVVVSRTFAAPREAVFDAWTDPEKWAKWFAPEPMTVPRAETDPQPGGRYVFVMRDQEGNDYMSTGVYREVSRPERLVYTDSASEMPRDFLDMVNEARGALPATPIADGIVTITFEETAEGTKMTFSEEFDTKSTRDAWVELQMVEGLEAGFDALEKLLTVQPSFSR